jgi:hypothetical protein
MADWNCRAGHNVVIRTDGTLGPCFPMYSAIYDLGTIALAAGPERLKRWRPQLRGLVP